MLYDCLREGFRFYSKLSNHIMCYTVSITSALFEQDGGKGETLEFLLPNE